MVEPHKLLDVFLWKLEDAGTWSRYLPRYSIARIRVDRKVNFVHQHYHHEDQCTKEIKSRVQGIRA